MPPVVGIPRALLWHRYGSAWEAYFAALGVPVLLSSPSSEAQVTAGSRIAHPDNCLPVKLAYGHLAELKDRCDLIYLPKAVRLAKGGFLCPKMIGFSDMIRHQLRIDPRRILDAEWDLHSGSHARHFLATAWRLTRNPVRIARGLRAVLPALAAIDGHGDRPVASSGDLTLGVVGHPYNVQDPAVNMNLLAELSSRGATPLTERDRPPRYVPGMFDRYPAGLFWSFGREILATAKRFLEPGAADGLIYVIPFGCGLDSVLMSLVEAEARAARVPFLPLVVDEHTGRAAFLTRVEAFLDLLRFRRQGNGACA